MKSAIAILNHPVRLPCSALWATQLWSEAFLFWKEGPRQCSAGPPQSTLDKQQWPFLGEARNPLVKAFKRPQLRLEFTSHWAMYCKIGTSLKGKTPEVQTEAKIKSQTFLKGTYEKNF